MYLEKWLALRRISKAWLAEELGVSAETLYRIGTSKQRLSARLAEEIEHITDGEVTRVEVMWPLWCKERGIEFTTVAEENGDIVR